MAKELLLSSEDGKCELRKVSQNRRLWRLNKHFSGGEKHMIRVRENSIVYCRNKIIKLKPKHWSRNIFYAKLEKHYKNRAPCMWSYVAQRESWNGGFNKMIN